jgi:hypothetical protein
VRDEIPFDDPSPAALTPSIRAAVAESWRTRAASELRVGRAFGLMAPRLRACGAIDPVLDRLARAAEEEARHAALCVRLAGAYAGESIEAPDVGDVELPRFGAGDEELECALVVAGMCCINETVATAWLGACLDAATTPIAAAANRAHLADEIEHARLGWAHLASRAVSPETRRGLARWVPALLEANAPAWEREDPGLPREGIPAHGILGVEETRRVVREAVRDLVIPGFGHVGVELGGA